MSGRAFLKLILNEDKRLLGQSCLYEKRRPSFKETLMYLPTLFFTLFRYTLNVWTRIARQAPEMIEAVQYIFLEITLSLFTAILYVISKKCQRTALGY